MTPHHIRTPLPNDDTPIVTPSFTTSTDTWLQLHLKELSKQVALGNARNDAQNQSIIQDIGSLRTDVTDLRTDVTKELAKIDGKFQLVDQAAGTLKRQVDDIDATRRWAIGALLTSLATAVGSLAHYIFHSSKG